jgi:hypothetical protein
MRVAASREVYRPLGVRKPRFANAAALVALGEALLLAINPYLPRLNRAQRRDWARAARRSGKGWTR